MKKNIFKRRRVVMTTMGSLGDLHPYIALALEMRKRYIDPVIATSRTYRERIESLNIEFREIRPTALEPDTPEYFNMVEKVVDPQRGAEYLFKELLVPSVRDMYADLREAIEDADLLVTHPLILAGPLVAQKTGIPWVSTELAPSSLWSAFDPFVPPNMPRFHRVLKAGGPIATRLYMKLVKALSSPWFTELYEFRDELGLPPGEHPLTLFFCPYFSIEKFNHYLTLNYYLRLAIYDTNISIHSCSFI